MGLEAVAIAVAVVLTSVVLVLLGVRQYLQRLRAGGRAAIQARYPASEVLLSETLAQSFGQQSRGAAQLRGSGALALTPTELFFRQYVTERDLAISLSSVAAVSLVRSHLGKTQGANLLHVRWAIDGVEDAIAWRVPNADAWKSKIESLRT